MLDEFVIDVAAIGQEHSGKGAPVLVEAVSLKRDFFPKGEVRGRSVSLACDNPVAANPESSWV